MLEQSTATFPFMGKLIVLFHIARRTRQYNKVHIMARTILCATQGDCMLKMKDIPTIALLKLGKATSGIIAAIVLCLQFGLYLLRSKRPLYSFLLCISFMLKSTPYLSPMLRLSILSIMFTDVILMSFVRLSVLFSPTLSVSLTELLVSFKKNFSIGFAVLFTPFIYLCLVILYMLLDAISAIGLKLIIAIFIMREVSKRQIFSTLPTLLISLWGFIFVWMFGKPFSMTARFAVAIPATFIILASAEKFRSRGKQFLAFSTVLARGIIWGYIGHTAEPPILLSRSGVFQHRQSIILFPPLYHKATSQATLGGEI